LDKKACQLPIHFCKSNPKLLLIKQICVFPDADEATISPMNEKYLAEEHEMYLPVVQVEHLDLISTLSANPAGGGGGASTSTVEEFTKHSAGVTESSVEAPSEASSDSYEARTEEPLHEADAREELDEENMVTTVASEKLREGDDFDLQTTTVAPQFKEELKDGQVDDNNRGGEEKFFDTEEPPVTQTAEEMGELRELTTEEPDSSAELRQDDAEETSTTEPPPEDENVSAEIRTSEDEEVPEPFTSTTTDHSMTSTTAFEGLVTTTSTYDATTTRLATIPDVIVGKNIEEDEPKVTELNAELMVQDANNADVVFLTTTTAEPPLVESVETVSIASAEGGDAVGAEIRLEETTGGASNSSELKILQVLYTNNNNNNNNNKEEPMIKSGGSSRSADSSDVLFLPQVPRPLMAPAAAVNSHDWKAAAFEETKDELISGLWHEALDILTGGRAAAIRATARKTHNSKFINRE